MTVAALALVLTAGVFAMQSEAAYASDGSSDMTWVSVGIKHGENAVDRCDIYSDDGFQIVNISEGMEETLPLTGYDHLVVTAENGMINVYDADGVTLVTDLGSNNVIMNGDYLGEGSFKSSVNSREYRGGLKFFVRSNGDLNVINYLSLDHYLYGVIQGEMGSHNPMEALKAQTVAARSYAMSHRSSHRSEGFDLCNVSHCQMYYGVQYEKPETVEAVDETSELVMWYDGKIVPAYYHKNSGGYTQNAEDVWGSEIGYIRSIEDEYCPEYKWSVSYTWEQLGEKFTDIGRVKDAYITDQLENGHVRELTIVGTHGERVLKREKIRSAFGASVVKSLTFDLEGGSGDIIVIPASATVLSADGVKEERADLVVYGGEDNFYTYDKLDGMTILSADGEHELKDQEIESMASDEGITITGYGYGHSIGMPQDSAIAMAEDGWEFEDILHYFYTDIEIDYVSQE